MNLPNKLTVLRVLMIPLFLFFFMAEELAGNYFWALIIFAAASITDMLDGQIARKRGLVTDFGKLMDPLADKLLVMSALICLLQGRDFWIICLILIMSREFLVTSIRLLAAGKGTVIAADIWGKLKTASQMVWICLALLDRSLMEVADVPPQLMVLLEYLVLGLFYAMVALTVLSGVNYCWKNRRLFVPTQDN